MMAYPDYKECLIPNVQSIPLHWHTAPLKHIGEVILGKMLTPRKKEGYLLKPYLRAKNIQWEVVDTDNVKSMWFSAFELDKYKILINDLLISEGGEVGRTAIWKAEFNECYIQNSVHKVTINPNHYPRYFLYHSVLFGKTNFYDSITNRVSIGHLTKEKIQNIQYLLPPLSEQRTIATFLDRKTAQIDTLIAKKQRLIELLQEQRNALINQAVTKGLNPDVPMKDSGIEWLGEIPEHWKVMKLKHAAIVNREALSENSAKEYVINYIDIGNVDSTGLMKPPKQIPFGDAPSRARRLVKKSDVIISTVRTYLKAIAYIDSELENLIASTGFATLTACNYIDPRFLFSVVSNQNFVETVSANSVGVSYPAITSFDLANIPVWFPPIKEEQENISKHITDKIEQIDVLVSKLKNILALFQEYRTTLISAAVTGKIDLRE